MLTAPQLHTTRGVCLKYFTIEKKLSLEEFESLEKVTKTRLQYYRLTEQIQLQKPSLKYLMK